MRTARCHVYPAASRSRSFAHADHAPAGDAAGGGLEDRRYRAAPLAADRGPDRDGGGLRGAVAFALAGTLVTPAWIRCHRPVT